MKKKVGHYAFIVGVVVAILLGLASANLDANTVAWLTSLLVVAGLLVGFINVTGKDTKDFLLTATILVLVASFGADKLGLEGVHYIGDYLSGIFQQMLAFIVPATVVIALEEVLQLAKAK